MKLTKRGEYALHTLIRLGIADRQGEGVISVSMLAEQERLPLKFLEAIPFGLKQAGHVESLRGRHGGERLAKPAKSIKMGDVVRLIEGDPAPIGCASQMVYEKCSCHEEEHCGLRVLMIDVRNAVANILDRSRWNTSSRTRCENRSSRPPRRERQPPEKRLPKTFTLTPPTASSPRCSHPPSDVP